MIFAAEWALTRSGLQSAPTIAHAGLAAKAGKPSSAKEAKSLDEAVSSVSKLSDRPATEYPSWLQSLTKPGKTLGELKRTPVEDRTYNDVRLHWLLTKTELPF